MNKPFWLRVVFLVAVPLIFFWFAYYIRADQKRTLVHLNGVYALAFVDGGKKLALSSGSMGSLYLWNVPTRKLIRRQENYSSCQVNDQFFRGGSLYAHFNLSAHMEVRDVQTSKIVKSVDCSKEINAKYASYEELRSGILSNNGKILALTTWIAPNVNSQKYPSIGKLRLWNLETHEPICTIRATEFPRNLKPTDYYIAPLITSSLFAPDDETVAIGLST